MAIEPISSAMTFQAQNTQQAKPVSKPAVENTEVAAPDQTVKVDATTVQVTAVEKKKDEKGQNGNQASQQQVSDEQIRKAVEQLNKRMAHSTAVYGFHEDTNRVMIKIVDKDTKEVIKELPPEKTLDMIAKAWELAGMLVDERR